MEVTPIVIFKLIIHPFSMNVKQSLRDHVIHPFIYESTKTIKKQCLGDTSQIKKYMSKNIGSNAWIVG
jgi:hypothetical protein